MQRDTDAIAVPAEQVELALALVERSAAFRGSPRHRALLRWLAGGPAAGR